MTVPGQKAPDLREEGFVYHFSYSFFVFQSYSSLCFFLSQFSAGNMVIWPPIALARLANTRSD